jgi:transposase
LAFRLIIPYFDAIALVGMWKRQIMEIMYQSCAGLDVHKKSVVVCRITPKAEGGWAKDIKTFGTFTEDLLTLLDWLRAGNVTHIAMESTGVYWKPIYNILEAEMKVMLVNARHIKFVPGRKTDVKDAQWIAELLQHGLLKASYIPPLEQRDLWDLVRYRTRLIQDRAREVNRVQKVLEDANIKLASVVSDIMGVSSRDMLTQLIAGQDDPQQLAQLARSRLREKIDDLNRALTGHVRAHHRLLLQLHLEHIDELNAKITLLSEEIDRLLVPFDQIGLNADAIPWT